LLKVLCHHTGTKFGGAWTSHATGTTKSDEFFLWVFVTGSTVHNAKQQYLSYSEGDFEVIRPIWATCCTRGGGEIWHGGVDHSLCLRAKFHLDWFILSPNFTPIGAGWGYGTLKTENFMKFYQILEYKCSTGVYPLCTFYEITSICTL